MPKDLAQELDIMKISWQSSKQLQQAESGYWSVASSVIAAFFIVICSSYSLSAIYYYLLSKY